MKRKWLTDSAFLQYFIIYQIPFKLIKINIEINKLIIHKIYVYYL